MASFIRTSTSKSFQSAARFYSTSISRGPIVTAGSFAKNPYLIASSFAIAGTASFLFYSSMTSPASASTPVFTGEFVDLTLTKVTPISKNSGVFTFAFDDKDAVSGLVTASAVVIKYLDDASGKNIIRPYTPITDVETKGYLDLLVKEYPNGKASVHIHSLKPGDKLAFKGPIVKYAWTANKHDEIALVGGGTGITPLWQLIHEINKNPEDKTKVTLVYGNISEDDILLKKEIDAVVAAKPEQFKVVYALDKAPEGWTGVSGYITKDVLSKALPSASSANVKVFVCGPPGLYAAVSGKKVSPADQGEVDGILKDLGFNKEQVFKF
ncbi:NADH-cytochrome b5 reductase [Lipomyces japonicus]|uniref:NADH-cytochrome b5 reductase n=1 Tax=Lipomyces japonicus TaxID=56871 RepID=UPI0034D01B2C